MQAHPKRRRAIVGVVAEGFPTRKCVAATDAGRPGPKACRVGESILELGCPKIFHEVATLLPYDGAPGECWRQGRDEHPLSLRERARERGSKYGRQDLSAAINWECMVDASAMVAYAPMALT